jgi:endoglucanase
MPSSTSPRRRLLAGAALALCLTAAHHGAATERKPPATIGLAASTAAANPAAASSAAVKRPRGAELLARLWPSYRDRFIRPDGRVVDNGNGNISHSEGQGYAMVLAVAAQDREAFDRIWTWTGKQLGIRPDGLHAWRWQPDATPNVTDQNNASDGDLLIAWALGEAALRWDEPAYGEAMRRITRAIFQHNVAGSRLGPILLPGANGFRAADQPDGPIVNLSYWIFPAIDRLQKMDTTQDWAALRRSGLALLRESRFGPLSLPSEWVSIGEKRATFAASFERSFGYNAVRIPLYAAWSSRVATDHLRPYLTMWSAADNIGPFVIDIEDGKARETLDAPGYKMIFALTQCIAQNKSVSPELVMRQNDLYYPATLGLLSLLAISERKPQCL